MKILNVEHAADAVRAAQRSGETVVQCHGCFDIVHPGHIRHLRHARSFGTRLLVTITGDAVMSKGEGRPLIPQELRAENLAALDFVDWVAINDRPTAAELLERIQPDVYVKGKEYERNGDPRFLLERQIVERHGGRVVFSSGDVVFSSTALIAAMEARTDPFQSKVRELVDRHQLDAAGVDAIVGAFRGKRVVVCGDVIVDTYVLCDRAEVAGESAILSLRPVDRRSFDGGAAIIAQHLAAMGASPILVTSLPRNLDSERLRRRLADRGIETRHVECERPIVEKQRFLVGAQKVMKLDLGQRIDLDAAQRDRYLEIALDAAKGADAAIIADFALGLLNAASIGPLCRGLRERVRILSGDVSGRRASLLGFEEMDLLCPSESEVREAMHLPEDGLASVVWSLLDVTHSRAAIVTLGPDGLIAFDRPPDAERQGSRWLERVAGEHVPSFAPFAVDQLGCGDALLSAATLTLAAGGSVAQAAILGNVAAASEAQRLGNIPIDAAEIRRGLLRLHNAQLAYGLAPTATLVGAAAV
ncbi:MAG: adenylyltransferase/cytidyltransferase family protein [Phycisphaerae bacterium]|jgi:rfaE bifunctional protein nucleotidyltransferase chain/domain|nr:adenylyltransferase/cytidyltransferase family protein [Phycisphaerae bacterium]